MFILFGKSVLIIINGLYPISVGKGIVSNDVGLSSTRQTQVHQIKNWST